MTAREDRKQVLTKSLVDAAERIVSRRGLGGLKARELATEAGCALGAIYTVFPDLDRLVLALGARTLARLKERLATCAIPQGPDAEGEVGYLVALSEAYLDFAAGDRLLWLALFEHRMSGGREAPEEMRAEQLALFAFVERSLKNLRPDLPDGDCRNLARTLFSAVHGIIVLGLEEKLTSLPHDVLAEQIALVVTAIARGLIAASPSSKV